ncbi:hypothetical protein SAMN04487926_101465 [Paraburkholderia steynii]|uniref:Uncharacterized protein n=1 Tax=Paraburkholderia steynii TaxID=1245441 RepID=A0A7Z7B2G2_9BURK|nr:hypothetical protein SAMN04487926_101465 [Paraburkholderia steynii]
MNYGEAKPEF